MATEPEHITDTALLRAHNLACAIDGRALWNAVQITVRPGERWAVAGPSGSGKTLLLRTLAGLAPAATGKICFAGKPLDTWPMPAYRARVVYLSQRPALPEGTVKAALAAPFKLRSHREKTFPVEMACRYLDALDMNASFLEQHTDRLSGGEAQLAAALRAILVEPSVLLLDEPTASLDAARAEHMESLIGAWLGNGERAYVWTSHDRAQLERVSDHMLTLGRPT